MTQRDLLILESLLFLLRPDAWAQEYKDELYERVLKEFGKATEEVEG